MSDDLCRSHEEWQELSKRRDLAREIGRELRDLGSDRLQELLGVIRLYKLPTTTKEKAQ